RRQGLPGIFQGLPKPRAVFLLNWPPARFPSLPDEMKAIQPTAIINPSDPQKIRKFRDRGATQIRDSRIRPASTRWLRHYHAAEARDMPISDCDSSGTLKRLRSGGDDLAKTPSIRPPEARAARGGPSSPARALLTPFS